MFDKAALVVAHPDDEALWFSSIVQRVDEVVICFTDIVSRPDWSEGRRRSIASYPIRNATFLGLQESEVYNCTDWLNPVLTDYGLEVSKRKDSFAGFSAKRYRNNYVELRQQLSTRLKKCRNVFTHNPWGEYGHEEHVQVFRVIQELQRELSFDLWFSNYCSNKSHKLMLQYISGFDSSYVTIECDRELWKSLMLLYKRNNCWTWFDDYTWFAQECFMLSKKEEVDKRNKGHIFPLNFIKLDFQQDILTSWNGMSFRK
jgi:GlcNAc-PI de-N-acetylase.